ncbi:LOW QUALITY PROTEIN: disease resistance protein RUN1-like [Argentina anserina]|uniref:LOW QUALITY PROTEIN: disease resistance protein RUN1-like n=1 Tax=Argentina anserina TaxID=57926 RepID=UPI0021764190|nr:LOW QUALITY PROTEIN: disease resistance protein RUN1-like [Potentilla anserina]
MAVQLRASSSFSSASSSFHQQSNNSDLMTLQLRESSSFSSLPSSACSYKYDVFLSFRGHDTRHGFTGHLYNTLVRRGVKTFKDDDELPRGEAIAKALIGAVEESKLSLIVFSENYASSRWCLDELVHILECRRSKNQMVHPIFYKVHPSDVRHQRGKYGEALARHKLRFDDGTVTRWRAALKEAADLSGSQFSGGYEHEFIERIVEEVSAQVKEPTYLDVARYPVGIHSRVQDMLQLLDVGGSYVRMVGIWGTGGIGKTTIAKAVYNEVARKFDGCCFLANVREGSEQGGGLINLQNIVLSRILGGEELKIINVDEGVNLLRERFKNKRILLILDDVNKSIQLDKLAGAPDWFGSGSRVIITTRDKRLLDVHEVRLIYKASALDHDQSCELFNSNAFKNKRNPDNDEKRLINTIVRYAKGLPLALKVLGSHLYGRHVHDWQDMLDGFKIDLYGDMYIREILKVSYDGLEETEKEVFLDIACFFKGWKTEDVKQMLEGCDRNRPKHCITVLEEKALINVDYYGRICMHDMLEEMGKNITRQQSPNLGERTRLWHHKDVRDILTEGTGTRKIEGIIVEMPTEDVIHLSPKCFKKMKNLKIFINVNGRFVGKVDYYPNQLRVLDWSQCPLESLPYNFNTMNMVHFHMEGSRISRLGPGFKSMRNLTTLNLSGSKFLTEIPDVSGSPNLEVLYLINCMSLVEVHPSVGSLQKLVKLGLWGYKILTQIPDLSRSPNLQILNLRYCECLVEVHPSVGFLEKLVELDLWGCKILTQIPDLSGSTNLQILNLTYCECLVEVHPSVGFLEKLQKLRCRGCKMLTQKPRLLNRWLDLRDCEALDHLPSRVDIPVLIV